MRGASAHEGHRERVTWRSLDSLIEETETPANAARGIWNRADIETHTVRIRDYSKKPRPVVTHPNRLKTHCPKGHPYDEANTYTNPNRPGRECRQCRRERQD